MVSGLFPRLRRKSPVGNAAGAGAGSASTSAPAADPLQGVRPKLLLDSIFLPTEKGVYFRSRQGHFTLGGKGTYELVSELVPRLTGKQTVDDLCEGLEAERRDPARKLIATLLEKRILINHVEEVTDLSPSVLRRFAPQIEFIEHFADAPVRRFATFRHSRILLMGSGEPLRALALSLARNGLEKILLEKDAPPVDRDRDFLALAEDHAANGIALSVERTNLADESAKKSSPQHAICYVNDFADLQKISSLNERACSSQTHFLSGYLLGGKAFIGPLVRNNAPSCWMCSLLRHSTNVKSELEALIWKHFALSVPWDNDGQPASAPLLRILGNLMGFEMFRFFVGHIPIETDATVLSIDTETLETGTSRLLPHPNCPACSKAEFESDRTFLSTVRTDTARENLEVTQKLRILAPLVDPDFGIIQRFDDDDLEQSPLFQSAVVVGRHPNSSERNVPGYSIQNNATARVDAVLSALKLHVTSIPSERRIWEGTRNEAVQKGLNPLPHGTLSNWMGGPKHSDNDKTQWVYGRALGAGTIHLIDAGAVYARCSTNRGDYEKTDAGAGIGLTFRQACGEAILSLFAHEVLKRIATNEITPFELDTDYLAEENANIRYLRNVFGHIGRNFRLLGFTHDGSGSIMLAFAPGDAGHPDKIAVGTAAFLAPAVVSALTDLLALTVGGTSTRTVEQRLPRSLGYIVDFSDWEEGLAKAKLPMVPGNQNMNSVLVAFRGAFSEIVVANLTNEDLRQCGLIAVKAVFVRDSREP